MALPRGEASDGKKPALARYRGYLSPHKQRLAQRTCSVRSLLGTEPCVERITNRRMLGGFPKEGILGESPKRRMLGEFPKVGMLRESPREELINPLWEDSQREECWEDSQ